MSNSDAACITLTEAEIKVAEYLVKARRRVRSEWLEEVRSKRDVIELERDAMEAEIAFCRSQNIYPDIDATCRSTAQQFDCVTSTGVRVDVKWCGRPTDHLMTMPHKIGCSDIDAFVLVQGKRPTYRIVGWVPFATLINVSNLRDFGYGPTYAMKQEDLLPIETLDMEQHQ
jgi:hypothetical protein